MKTSRRRFIGGLAAGLASMASAHAQPWRPAPRVKDSVETLGTAKNLIFVLLNGGPSQVDTLDLKTGAWTPDSLGAGRVSAGFDWPMSLMPRLAQMSDRFSLLRSLSASEAVHSRAVYHLLTAHRQDSAPAGEIPHFASMVSYMLRDQRKDTDTLPTIMAIGETPGKNGFLPVQHQALELTNGGGVPNLEHFQQKQDRFDLLENLMEAHSGLVGKQKSLGVFQNQARHLMKDEDLNALVGDPSNNNPFDNGASFRVQCETAVKILASGKGTRVFQLEIQGWDHHANIYNANGLLPLARSFDDGFGYMIEALDALPGENGGTLLDETLLVGMGEFGRTVGNLNNNGGRDHYPFVVPAILAGGGVKPGRAIGSTNRLGSAITDPGWSRNRFMSISDLTATLYSAMGIDYTQRFQDTPSGRVFEMVDNTTWGQSYAIEELFV